ncbi:hypothetical protein [Lawsonibacter hominis]|uniref:hypothetical protein n=1 Tax=Lawsonibacter hominis TaxID=2763053 RepID=UPI00331F10EB
MRKKYYLKITGTKNFEWQGTIQSENGSETPFESVLELLKAVNSDLAQDANTFGTANQSWCLDVPTCSGSWI